MLVIVSDLHFQQTDPDSIRYVTEQGEIFQTGVRRNVRVPALDHFFRRVADNAEECGAETVHIVFAGDIFELHRSPIWFMDKNPWVRPYHPIPHEVVEDDKPENPLEERVLDLLDHLEAEHSEVWKRLREWVTSPYLHLKDTEDEKKPEEAERKRSFEYVVHYIPGNHDRLANATPKIRRRIRHLLSMPEQSGFFPVYRDFGEYEARVRHGHEYDKLNFGQEVKGGASLNLGTLDYLEPTFGDYVTVEVATRLALAFRVYYGSRMRAVGEDGDKLRGIYQDLLEFDDVRPMEALFDYLGERTEKYVNSGLYEEEKIMRQYRKIIRDIMNQGLSDPFLKNKKDVLGWKKHFISSATGALSKALTGKALVGIIKGVTALKREKKGPSDIARYEPKLDEQIRLVFGGHTHRPEVVAIVPPGKGSTMKTFYINTGTWRTTIPQGAGTFGRYRAITYAFCYTKAEQAELPDRKRFELWSGAMAQADAETDGGAEESRPLAKPYDAKADKLGSKTYTLRIERLKVNEVPTDGGAAELKLSLGVDGYPDREIEWDGVKAKSERRLTPSEGTFTVRDSLDGEIRLYGEEKDLRWPDPLPWALYRLPRAGEPQNGKVNRFQPGDPFETGSGAFMMHGYGHTQIIVHYTLTANEE